jgi:5-(carboxyamino)imidazole ribonucleotide mutase
MKAVIIMGSKSDMNHSKKIAEKLKEFGIDSVLKVASAHKTPLKVLEIVNQYEGEDVVFVTVAGRSNALSGFVDANTAHPVIACPPPTNFVYDIFSSIRMPSGVAPLFIMDAENAALAVAKIFALKNRKIAERVKRYQENKKKEVDSEGSSILEV